MPIDAQAEAALIEAVRRVAKDEILTRFRNLSDRDVKTKSAPDDLVTEADTRAEAALTKAVHDILPGTAVVGEEAVAADPSVLKMLGSDRVVIIDPIDGTWNFAKGLATFGVILAVAEKGETVLGLLYDPVLDDWVLARKGGGTWFCRPGQPPMRLTIGGDIAADVMTGVVPLFMFPEATRQRLLGAIPGFRRIWSVRCSCHEYRLAAQGNADFILTAGINPWDHAAGALAVAEAGGAVGLLDGGRYDPTITEGARLVSARSPEVLDRIRAAFFPLIDG